MKKYVFTMETVDEMERTINDITVKPFAMKVLCVRRKMYQIIFRIDSTVL